MYMYVHLGTFIYNVHVYMCTCTHVYTNVWNLVQVTGDRSSTLLYENEHGEGEKRGDMMEEEQLPDRNDFGGGDFLEDFGGLGGLEGLGEVPSVGDITLEGGQREEGEETGE